MRFLLPSEKLAVFNAIMASFIPQILGKHTCSQIQVVITDGDSQEIKACELACKTVFPNATHINCLWHLINKTIISSKVIVHHDLKRIIHKWLTYSAFQLETEEEHKQALTYLKVCCISY